MIHDLLTMNAITNVDRSRMLGEVLTLSLTGASSLMSPQG